MPRMPARNIIQFEVVVSMITIQLPSDEVSIGSTYSGSLVTRTTSPVMRLAPKISILHDSAGSLYCNIVYLMTEPTQSSHLTHGDGLRIYGQLVTIDRNCGLPIRSV
jgi:hypothetical protein